MNRLFHQPLLVFTFFSRLKQQHPKLFYLFIILVALQLMLTVVKLEVTPFFLYGMFSEKIPVQDTISKTVIYADGKKLQTQNLSERELQLLETNVEDYVLMHHNKGIDVVQTRVESRYPFFTNTAFYPFIKNKIYNRHEDLKKFEQWFKQKCSDATHQNIQSITLVNEQYLFMPNPPAAKLLSREAIATF